MDEMDLARILERCLAHGRRADWDRFIQLAQPVVAAGVLRAVSPTARVDRELVDDLIQDTFLKICAGEFRVLREFRADDTNALQVYLKTIAASIAIDHFRSICTHKRGSGKETASLDDIEHRLATHDGQFDDLERRLLLEQVERCLDSQEPRSRRIFWLYHRQGLKPKSISALPGIGLGPDGVETAVYRLTKAVRDCLQRARALNPAAIREGGSA